MHPYVNGYLSTVRCDIAKTKKMILADGAGGCYEENKKDYARVYRGFSAAPALRFLL